MWIAVVILGLAQLVSFYMIVLLFLKAGRLKSIEERQQRIIQEMEDIISAYTLEIQHENERFFAALAEKNRPAAQAAGLADAAEEQQQIPEELLTEARAAADLQSKGFTVEEIAKAMKKGKTEVELMLKFNSKKSFA